MLSAIYCLYLFDYKGGFTFAFIFMSQFFLSGALPTLIP